ncbi:S41 family peptidase [Veillonella sp. YH-vei2232]|uniref:S41 family peptidase n=1 Tax=Veillonella absiana TaxID=3079305 RepID=A0ABU3Z9P4_9FIRM|nr:MULTISPECIES: S41 family peptidase [unclassified Veillonella]MBK7921552.1 S41 family peptidase [Veillonella sp.]MBP6922519.1 S41 family peptidase [Veillonella sp.]MBP9551584.1 S41 family peptidase [Veillonella sp.]MDV5062803.1 S41 family peptidase [Veillonella sp. YH-vei2232]MDV5088412.1 S41 family peptidase [Veillonella sp. YH-vei2233]
MNKQILWSVSKSILKILGSGILVMWLVFWYLSGTFWGFPRYMFTYYVSSQVFMTPVAKQTLFEGSLKGMVSSLGEPHSQYLDAEDYTSIMEQTSATYSGVGMVLGMGTDGLEAVSAIEDQPAARAGIESGDRIIKINDVDTSTLTIEEASKRVRGEAGTDVTLVIKRGNEEKTFTITREKITLPTVKSKMLTPDVGYIRISQFAENTGNDFGLQYQDLKKQGMKKLIIDLRDNPGGLLTTAQEISDFILPKGTLVTVQDRSGKVAEYDSAGIENPIPLVILINKGSASASEIIAGAVQDRKAGTIVGTNSYGKGTVQTILPDFGNEAIKITIAKYHTPNDRVIDGIGIKPDVEIALPDGTRTKGTLEDVQVQKAFDILNQE